MADELFHFDEFEFDRVNHQLRRAGRPVALQKIPFELLGLLVERREQLVTREEIVERIWGKGTFLDIESAVSTAVRKLRRALGDDAAEPKYIETVPGSGYRFRSIQYKDAPSRPTIAVLPLEDLSDETHDYFSDGMTEEILTHLGRLHPQLGVIARTSVMKYKATLKSVRQIGKELSVKYVLEGIVRRHGGRVRVNVQLIEAENQMHVWAESYEHPLDDVLELQDRLAREIAGHISSQLTGSPVAPSTPKVGRAAYEAYLKGRYFYYRRTETAMMQSIEQFELAIQLQPAFARPYAGLADVHIFLGIQGFRLPADTYPAAEKAARQALALDEALPEALNSLAQIQALFYWDWNAAEPLFRRAIELNANYSTARFFYAGVLSDYGYYGEAIRQIEIARELDPVSVTIQAFAGYVYYRARRYERAEKEIRRAMELDPNYPIAYWNLGLVLQELGKSEAAIESFENGVRLAHEATFYLGALGHAYGRAHKPAKAREVLNRLLKLAEERYVSPLDIAVVQIGMGEQEKAIEWLEKAYQQRVTRIRCLRDSYFDELRTDARFLDLMARIGLPA